MTVKSKYKSDTENDNILLIFSHSVLSQREKKIRKTKENKIFHSVYLSVLITEKFYYTYRNKHPNY